MNWKVLGWPWSSYKKLFEPLKAAPGSVMGGKNLHNINTATSMWITSYRVLSNTLGYMLG
jgi:hypothetical protein